MSYGGEQHSESIDSFYSSGALGGDRVVMFENGSLKYVDVTNPLELLGALGITVASIAPSSNGTVQRFGSKEDSAWNWDTSLPIYLGLNGVMVQQVSPSFKFIQIVAIPLSTTKIFVRIHPPILLS